MNNQDRSGWPRWLKDAETENARVETVNGRVIWHDGVWLNGIWRGGYGSPLK